MYEGPIHCFLILVLDPREATVAPLYIRLSKCLKSTNSDCTKSIVLVFSLGENEIIQVMPQGGGNGSHEWTQSLDRVILIMSFLLYLHSSFQLVSHSSLCLTLVWFLRGVEIFLTSQPIKKLTKTVGLFCNSSHIFNKIFSFLFQGKERPAKTVGAGKTPRSVSQPGV